jgi:predicted dehydrogenase
MAAAKKRKVKVGIIGLGRAGYGMHCAELDKYKQKFQIVAGCDPLQEKRERFQEKIKKAKVYKTEQELINDPEVELISIANRTKDHFATVLIALKSGKDVFLEKPICETYEEAKKIRTAGKRAKGTLYIRHNRRFESAFVHVNEIIDSGILGDVYEIKLARHSFQRRNDWQTLKTCGGGQLSNWGPHLIDHALQFVDGKVKDMWSSLKLVAASGDAEDHLKVIITGKNNRIIDVEISGGVALPSPVYAVYGTRGSLISEDEKTLKLRYLDTRKKLAERKANKGDPGTGFGDPDDLKWIEKEIPVKPKLKVDTGSIWKYLYDSIVNGKEFPITIDESVAVMRVISDVKATSKITKSKLA